MVIRIVKFPTGQGVQYQQVVKVRHVTHLPLFDQFDQINMCPAVRLVAVFDVIGRRVRHGCCHGRDSRRSDRRHGRLVLMRGFASLLDAVGRIGDAIGARGGFGRGIEVIVVFQVRISATGSEVNRGQARVKARFQLDPVPVVDMDVGQLDGTAAETALVDEEYDLEELVGDEEKPQVTTVDGMGRVSGEIPQGVCP